MSFTKKKLKKKRNWYFKVIFASLEIKAVRQRQTFTSPPKLSPPFFFFFRILSDRKPTCWLSLVIEIIDNTSLLIYMCVDEQLLSTGICHSVFKELASPPHSLETSSDCWGGMYQYPHNGTANYEMKFVILCFFVRREVIHPLFRKVLDLKQLFVQHLQCSLA